MDPLTRHYWNAAGLEPGRSIMLLMYHGTQCRSGDPLSKYDISAERFRQHLDMLKETGWNTAHVSALLTPDVFRTKSVVITFDDGFADNYEGAYMPLVERDMVATWFIVTGCVGKIAEWRKKCYPQARSGNLPMRGWRWVLTLTATRI